MKLFAIDDSLVKKASLLIFLVNGILLLLLGFILKELPPEIPLFYSRPWGEEQIVHRYFIFLAPTVGIILLSLHIFASRLIEKQNLTLRILIGGIVVVTLLGAITTIRIVMLVW
ncbi:hypothetical protein HY405_01085 [Candidatus Microgenomates bacterium]|nr:hypothetical protein [Candidatus Microgenomates bacterium]